MISESDDADGGTTTGAAAGGAGVAGCSGVDVGGSGAPGNGRGRGLVPPVVTHAAAQTAIRMRSAYLMRIL